MPEHGKLVVGFAAVNPKYAGVDPDTGELFDLTSKEAKRQGKKCEGTERAQYLQDVDAAVRIGMAKARFLLGKDVEKDLFKMKKRDNRGRRRKNRL